MNKVRSVFCLYAALAVLGAAVTALALVAAATSVRWRPPDPAELAEACRSLALPDLTLGAAFALLLGSGALAVVGLAACSAWRQLRRSRRFLSRLDIRGPVPGGTEHTYLFADEVSHAFCAGLLRPRIFVSTATVLALTDDELQAVLAHERQHARAHDPLRLLVVRTIGDGLFFVPGIRQLASRCTALAEIAGDEAAVRASGGDRQPLAAALIAIGGGANSAIVGVAPERVDRLLGDRLAWRLPIAALAWALVVLAAIAVVALRVADATAHSPVDLPMALAHTCMLAMAVAPLLLGVVLLLGSQRLLRVLR